MKSTQQLLNQIRSREAADLAFLRDPDYTCPPVAIYLCGLLAERGMTTKDAIQALGLDRTYGYQLFNGTRRPTRNVLIRLAALLELDLAATNRLLQIGGKQPLYPRVREDAAAIFAIEKRLPLERLDALLEGRYG